MISKGDMVYAFSSDARIREIGESGGAITSLLKFALERGIVDAVLGVEKGYDVYDPRPVLITDPADIAKTAGSLPCGTLLLSKMFSNYLDDMLDLKIAAPLKGCDVMGLYELAKRDRVNLDNVLMFGLNCSGSITPAMARRITVEKFGVDPDTVINASISRGCFVIDHEKGRESIPIDELEKEVYGRRSNCRRCSMKVPRQTDLACGNWGLTPDMFGKYTFIEVCSDRGAELLNKALDAGVIQVKEPGQKGLDIRKRIEDSMQRLSDTWRGKDFEPLNQSRNRLERMIEETSRCIKCYTCVDACPVLSGSKKPYLTTSPGKIPPRFEFHLIRYSHVADSCIDCGQCEELCPMDIPNSLFMHAIAVELEEMYGYHAGVDMSIPAIALMEDFERGEQ